MKRAQILLVACCTSLAFSATVEAQSQITVPMDQGFEMRVPAFPTGEERLRQPDLWMLDVDLKPMRLRTVQLTDAKSGEAATEQVWYLVYRVFNRPIRAAEVTGSVDPVNTLDTPYTRPLFQPQVTLITYDSPADQIPLQTIRSAVSPQAVQQLRRIEQRFQGVTINGPVATIQPLPEPAEDVKPLYAIAMFRGVDPETDFFKVIFRGLTNAYEIRDDADGKRVWRKVLVQKFKRPGDRFDPSQVEFDFDGDPVWEYVPAEQVENADIIAASEDNAAAAE